MVHCTSCSSSSAQECKNDPSVQKYFGALNGKSGLLCNMLSLLHNAVLMLHK